MAGTGLCPQLQHYSDAGQVLITEYIEGANFREVITPNELQPLCRGMGQWIGRYSRKSPRLEFGQGAATNWFDY